MRLVSYISKNGQISSGALTHDERIVDAGDLLGVRKGGAEWLLGGALLAALAEKVADSDSATLPCLGEVTLLPPIVRPEKILCVGLNYREHADEGNHSPYSQPTIFTRFADSQVGSGSPIVIPAESANFDYEGELAVVIGRGGRRISRAHAMDHVAGYSCYNDGSARDWQRHAPQWIPGKNFPHTGAFGPWLVTADEVADITDATLSTSVNGEVRQQVSVSQMLFDIPNLIEYVSSFTALSPGDVIVTGTPAGAGAFREPTLFLKHGDVVEVSITGIGTLTNPVVREQADGSVRS